MYVCRYSPAMSKRDEAADNYSDNQSSNRSSKPSLMEYQFHGGVQSRR